MGFKCAANEEEVVSLPSSFVKFSSGLRMLIVSFEKEISSLLKKLETRKRRGVKRLGEKKIFLSSSRFDREIRKLECSVNYNSSPSTIKQKGKGVGDLGKGLELSSGSTIVQ